MPVCSRTSVRYSAGTGRPDRQVHGRLQDLVVGDLGRSFAPQEGRQHLPGQGLDLRLVPQVGHRAGIAGEVRDHRRERAPVSGLDQRGQIGGTIRSLLHGRNLHTPIAASYGGR